MVWCILSQDICNHHADLWQLGPFILGLIALQMYHYMPAPNRRYKVACIDSNLIRVIINAIRGVTLDSP